MIVFACPRNISADMFARVITVSPAFVVFWQWSFGMNGIDCLSAKEKR